MIKIILFFIFSVIALQANAKEMLNVSYDTTREFYEEYNHFFASYWKKKTGEKLDIKQSHGGSGKQARAVIDGLNADIVTLALGYDIDIIAQKTKKIPENWHELLPNNSAPFYSTIVLVVRKGNPKNIRDWDDLVRGDVAVITPNPKISGGARWNYLAAWSYAQGKYGDDGAKTYIQKLFKNVPMLDSSARAATVSFAKREMGDVLIAWESEAYLVQKQFDNLEVIYPSMSIKAETPIAMVEGNAKEKGNIEAANEYLKLLYQDEAQAMAAKYYLRTKHSLLPNIPMKTIAEFGGWKKMQHIHFDDGGIFDQIYDK